MDLLRNFRARSSSGLFPTRNIFIPPISLCMVVLQSLVLFLSQSLFTDSLRLLQHAEFIQSPHSWGQLCSESWKQVSWVEKYFGVPGTITTEIQNAILEIADASACPVSSLTEETTRFLNSCSQITPTIIAHFILRFRCHSSFLFKRFFFFGSIDFAVFEIVEWV